MARLCWGYSFVDVWADGPRRGMRAEIDDKVGRLERQYTACLAAINAWRLVPHGASGGNAWWLRQGSAGGGGPSKRMRSDANDGITTLADLERHCAVLRGARALAAIEEGLGRAGAPSIDCIPLPCDGGVASAVLRALVSHLGHAEPSLELPFAMTSRPPQAECDIQRLREEAMRAAFALCHSATLNFDDVVDRITAALCRRPASDPVSSARRCRCPDGWGPCLIRARPLCPWCPYRRWTRNGRCSTKLFSRTRGARFVARLDTLVGCMTTRPSDSARPMPHPEAPQVRFIN